jgi:PTS system nitrogen regulatory IIA component
LPATRRWLPAGNPETGDRQLATNHWQRSMKLKDFIVGEAIVPELKADSRDGAIRELVEALAGAESLPRPLVDEIVAALIKREQNGSTGFGKGVAVPHVKHAKLRKMVGTVGRSVHGIDFAALDHQPVHSIVLLLSPENQPQQHLQAMNIVFSNLQKDMFRRFLRQSATQQAISDLLDEADQGK